MKQLLIVMLIGAHLVINAQKIEIGGKISVINTGKSVYLGDEAGKSDTNGSDHWNVGVGDQALEFDSTGTQNTALGNRALQVNGHASRNTAVGYVSMFKNESGTGNTAVGAASLADNASGSNNIALGDGAARFNQSGSTNTIVGKDAGYNATSASGRVLLGYQAGMNETGSNQLYIDNSNTSNALIRGDFSKDSLAINGELNVSGEIKISNSYTLPMTTGDNGQVLTTNGNGQTSWTTVAFDPPEQDTGVYVYSIKYVCGLSQFTVSAEDARVAGVYATSINVFNPTVDTITFVKKAILLDQGDLDPPSQTPQAPYDTLITEVLPPCWALQMVCHNIDILLGDDDLSLSVPAKEGFVVLQSNKKMDVTVVYTVGPLTEGGLVVSSMDIERIEPTFVPDLDIGF